VAGVKDGTEVGTTTSTSDDDDVEPSNLGLVLLSVMGALDFTMIAVSLLTAFNTRSVGLAISQQPLGLLYD